MFIQYQSSTDGVKIDPQTSFLKTYIICEILNFDLIYDGMEFGGHWNKLNISYIVKIYSFLEGQRVEFGCFCLIKVVPF